MQKLSITQEYLLCSLNEKGGFFLDAKPMSCLVLSGLLEMQMAKCIYIYDKKVHVQAGLPEHLAHLRPLYNVINRDKPMTVKEVVVDNYALTFTGKNWEELFGSLIESLKEADVVQPVQAGLFGKKVKYAPKKEIVAEIIEKIRESLSESGEMSEDVIVLTALLDAAGKLKDYLSKYEQKELKDKIQAIKNSESGAVLKELMDYIDMFFLMLSLTPHF